MIDREDPDIRTACGCLSGALWIAVGFVALVTIAAVMR